MKRLALLAFALAAALLAQDSPPPGKKKGGKKGPDNKGLIKPTMADTIKANIYADNWFVLYINGKLTAVDSIDFIPHNVVSVDILPEYPMTIRSEEHTSELQSH